MARGKNCDQAQTQTQVQKPVSSVVAEWGVRVAYAAVFAMNIACALAFVFQPESYLYSYEMTGDAGVAAIQGIGVAFLMWNVTYPAVIVSPRRFKSLAVVVLVQQVVGLVGELYIHSLLPASHAVLGSSIMRFVSFDGLGLIVMSLAFAAFMFVTWKAKAKVREH